MKPKSDDVSNVDVLLYKYLSDTSDEPTNTSVEDLVDNGTVGVFEGPLGEKKVGVVLTRETIQLYQPTRYGFQPEDLTVESFKWELSKKIEDFDFITRRTGTYLRCSV